VVALRARVARYHDTLQNGVMVVRTHNMHKKQLCTYLFSLAFLFETSGVKSGSGHNPAANNVGKKQKTVIDLHTCSI